MVTNEWKGEGIEIVAQHLPVSKVIYLMLRHWKQIFHTCKYEEFKICMWDYALFTLPHEDYPVQPIYLLLFTNLLKPFINHHNTIHSPPIHNIQLNFNLRKCSDHNANPDVICAYIPIPKRHPTEQNHAYRTLGCCHVGAGAGFHLPSFPQYPCVPLGILCPREA